MKQSVLSFKAVFVISSQPLVLLDWNESGTLENTYFKILYTEGITSKHTVSLTLGKVLERLP